MISKNTNSIILVAAILLFPLSVQAIELDSLTKIDDTTQNGPGSDFLRSEDMFGADVTSLGDLDGDGITDIAVGAPLTKGGFDAAGAVYILFMKGNGEVKQSIRIDQSTTNGPEQLMTTSLYGSAVANIGDLDNDGVPELAVGAERFNGAGNDVGAVFIHFLKRDGSIKKTVLIDDRILDTFGNFGIDPDDRFGSSLAGIGDLNKDGVNDIAVGAWNDEGENKESGAVYLLFMNSDASVQKVIKIDDQTPNGPGPDQLRPFDGLGSDIANMGDLDGDGNIELAVGAAWSQGYFAKAGAVYIFYLDAKGGIKKTVRIDDETPNGPSLNTDYHYGFAVENMGDLDNDSIPELAVGAYKLDGEKNTSGGVFIHYLNPDASIKKTVLFSDRTSNGPEKHSLDANDQLGSSLANIGDINNDGTTDLVVGAQNDEGYNENSGAIYTFFLSKESPSTKVDVVNIKSTIDTDGNTEQLFNDLNLLHPYARAILWAKNNDVVGGYPDGSFRPTKKVNRVEFLKVVLEAVGADISKATKVANFPDTSKEAWYAGYLNYAVTNGIVDGYPDGTFKPENTVNFAEALKIAYEAFQVPTSNVSGEWYEKYLSHAKNNDILFEKDIAAAANVSRQDLVWIVWSLAVPSN